VTEAPKSSLRATRFICFALIGYGSVGLWFWNYGSNGILNGRRFLTDYLDAEIGSYLVGFLTCWMALVVGCFLYQLRHVVRIHYALLEITFGLLSVFAASTTENVSAIQYLQIGAGIYIVVRGLDNLKVGLDAAPNHPLWALWNFES
jgi:hypothetical protein